MSGPAEKISGSELDVMEALWQAGEPVPLAPVRERLERERGWDASTVKTLLRRLCEKGAVRAEKREVFYYAEPGGLGGALRQGPARASGDSLPE